MDINLYVHLLDSSTESKLSQILTKLDEVINKEKKIMADLVTLEAQVTKNTDTEASAATLLTGISQLLADAIASGNPAKVQELQTKLATSADALAAAVVANTPVTQANSPNQLRS